MFVVSFTRQFANKLDQVESQSSSNVQSYDIDTVRRLLQQHQDLKKGQHPHFGRFLATVET